MFRKSDRLKQRLYALAIAVVTHVGSGLASEPFVGTASVRGEFDNRILNTSVIGNTQQSEFITLTGFGSVGSVGVAGTPVDEDGNVYLTEALLGAPMEILPEPDLYIGDNLIAIVTSDDRALSAIVDFGEVPNLSPADGAFYVDEERLFVRGAGFLEVEWKGPDGLVVATRTYLVSSLAAPGTSVQKLYWTKGEDDLPTGAPEVALGDSVSDVEIRYNGNVVAPEDNGGKSLHYDNATRSLWADGGVGHVVVEYRDGGGAFKGIQIVNVRPYAPDFPSETAVVGRLDEDGIRPRNPSGATQASPVISRGLGGDEPYVYDLSTIELDDENLQPFFAVRDTDGEFDRIEVFWAHEDALGMVWPYEMARYQAVWPEDDSLYQHFYHTHKPGGVTNPSPSIDLSGPDEVVIHYSDKFPKPPNNEDQSQNGDVRVWRVIAGSESNLYSKGRSSSQGADSPSGTGQLLLHYIDDNDFLGVEYVDVKHYIADHINGNPATSPGETWEIGKRILPTDERGGDLSVRALVTIGLDAVTSPSGPAPYLYQHTKSPSDFEGFVFPVRRSGDPENMEVFWMRQGVASVEWPYEMHRYTAMWPEKPQLFVRGHTRSQLGVSAQLPPELDPQLMPFQEPLHARIENFDFVSESTDTPGLSLLKFETDVSVGNHVFFQAVHSVKHNDEAFFDLTESLQNIGTQLVPPESANDYSYSDSRGYVFVDQTKSGLPDREDRYARGSSQSGSADVFADTGQIFGVNEGMLEVWWYNVVEYDLGDDQTIGVRWPSLARRYQLVWPENPEEIVISSTKGSAWADVIYTEGDPLKTKGFIASDTHQDASIYFQNDPSLPGFNPNDEHALLGDAGGGDAVFALRNDLVGDDWATTSQPYVLLQYVNPASEDWRFRVFRVIVETEELPFQYAAKAGNPILSPQPLGIFQVCPETSGFSTTGSLWRDRKGAYHSIAADVDQGAGEISMQFFYPVQEGFYFPEDYQYGDSESLPAVGDHIPWLDRYDGTSATPEPGDPVVVSYRVFWPDLVPEVLPLDLSPAMKIVRSDVEPLFLVETLVDSKRALPAIEGQSSVDILYQESVMNGEPEGSVKLIDPTRQITVSLSSVPTDATQIRNGGKVYFADLPPQLRSRIWYDEIQRDLVFMGEVVYAVAGEEPYHLMLNVVSAREKATLMDLSADLPWKTAIENLATLAAEVRQVVPEEPFESLALTSGLAKGSGYVTLAFGNSEILTPPADPVSLEVIKVEPPQARGEIKVIESENPFDEKLTLRHSGDFAGLADQYVFSWRYRPPENGLPSTAPIAQWLSYVPPPHPDTGETGDGAVDITIEGASLLTLTDNYFVCQYRPKEQPFWSTSANADDWWSDWTAPMLAEGWIKRVLAKIDPFEQRIKDYRNNTVDSIVSMISQAGPRWSGSIPLNNEGARNSGLIEIYETVLRRGMQLSIEGGLQYGPANDALLLAAGRLADLYMLLGNEAFADASDPTIGFGTSDGQYGTEAASIHCFMNQVPSLLEEELALLRGRDDKLLPTVRTGPFYNRLPWNFTRDIVGGEVAYALNYNIGNQDGSIDGSITEADAKLLYPQGHGDAWGHHLTAIKNYYRLLRHPNFDWVPRIEAVLVGGAPVSVDYLDERKFAQAAAARARTGAEIVDLTYRQSYVENPLQQLGSLTDSDEERAWGLSEWGARAGQGSYLDWVTANALLPSSYKGGYRVTFNTLEALELASGGNTNLLNSVELIQGKIFQTEELLRESLVQVLSEEDVASYESVIFDNIVVPSTEPVEGIQKIDRTTVLELKDIASQFTSIQAQVDQADTGLNPLGLARNVVAFDISPADLDAGKSHFEQIYDRAVTSMNNAIAVFNHAVNSTQLLRRQADNEAKFKENVDERENDFNSRLIEIFGTPYSDDLGPTGSYDTEYLGPDDLHYAYIDRADLEDAVELRADDIPFSVSELNVEEDGALSSVQQDVAFNISRDAWEMIKPSSWSGRRAAPGEIQQVLAELVLARVRFEKGLLDYDNLLSQIEDQAANLEAQYDLNAAEIRITENGIRVTESLNEKIAKSRKKQLSLRKDGRLANLIASAGAEMLPLSAGLSFDATSSIRGAIRLAGTIISEIKTQKADAESLKELDHQQAKEISQSKNNLELTTLRQDVGIQQQLRQIEQSIRQEASMRYELYSLREAITQAASRYLSVLAKGNRLLADRDRFRQNTATQVQDYRYKDMAFRIFRNDALQKYRAQFDLASRFVYMAAKAYDYETNFKSICEEDLAGSGGGIGGTGLTESFLTDIVRSRSLGTITGGVPQTGSGTGDAGLADPVARMNANFSILKPQLNINNPETETGRFSLRSELFRILPGVTGNEEWKRVLESHRVENLLELSAFKRYCIQFTPTAPAEPALVIPFSTFVNFGQNFFGWDAVGGDNAYDSTHYATKIRSAGVWFSNYNNLGSGMQNTPRVYLVPVGNDIMRAPNCDNGDVRSWKILDQVVPLPFPINPANLNAEHWLPGVDSMSGDFTDIRKYAMFRAYHDSGSFNPAETTKSSRLVGRSVWNTQWLLIIPAGVLHSDREEGLDRFIHGPLRSNGERSGNGVSDIKLFFQTYSYSGNVTQ